MADATPLRLRIKAFGLDDANARLTREGQPVSLPSKAVGRIKLQEWVRHTGLNGCILCEGRDGLAAQRQCSAKSPRLA
jgi:hypothetical protein